MAGIDQSTLWKFANMILNKSKAQPTTRERATFLRTDPDGTQWVRLPSSNDETPVNGRTLATAKAGDTVEWSIENGRLSITGNESQPSVGMREVSKTASDIVQPVVARVAKVSEFATLTKNVADAAQQVANAVNQHFFSDENGVHVTESTQEEWNESHTGANVLINAVGQLFRDGLNNLLTLTTESSARALTIWDGLGNTAEHVVATFSGNGIGLAGDAFHLTSVRTTTSGGDENIVSNIAMTSTNSSYGVRSLIHSNTSISSQWQGLSGYMGLSLAVGDSTFDNIDANPTIYMQANVLSSGITASADEISLLAHDQLRVETDEYALSFGNGTSNTWSTAAGTVIWSSSGWQMAANVTAPLTYNVSTCPSGIVLHWQAYANGATQDYDHVYTFVPKQHVVVSSGKGVVCQLANSNFGYVGTKYVYVANGGITGHANNQSTGTANGITYANNHWVLTQVIAV